MSNRTKIRKIIIDIGHPANVHLFKHFYASLTNKGWQCIFTVKNKEYTLELLTTYGLKYLLLDDRMQGLMKRAIKTPIICFKFLMVLIQEKPQLVISRGSVHSSVVCKFMRIPHLVFTDTESAGFLNLLSNYLASAILTGTSYNKKCGKNHIRYPGYHELAYLHPNRFTPNSEILERLGLHPGDKYAIVRFVSWSAHHDVGHTGISYENKLKLVKLLSVQLKVFISSEVKLKPELEKYRLQIKPEEMHDALAFAHLYIGESATMASECACLGVPAVYMNDSQLGYTNEQQRYGLLYSYTNSPTDQDNAIDKAIELASESCVKTGAISKRDRLLSEKIDVSAFMVWFVENYPNSKDLVIDGDFNWEQFKTRS